MSVRVIQGDCLEVLAALPADSVHCVVTSPPYWGLRDYGTGQWSGGNPECDHVSHEIRTGLGMEALGEKYRGGGKKASEPKPIQFTSKCGKCGAQRQDSQLGLEPTLGEHLEAMVRVFDEVRRVLRPDGTLWLNYGDCYATTPAGHKTGADGRIRTGKDDRTFTQKPFSTVGPIDRGKRANGRWGGGNNSSPELKAKDLCMVSNRLAIALQEWGWWVRSEIIWAKPNPMPESVSDRPTQSHEKVWLLTKSARYFYDAEAVREEQSPGTLERFGDGQAARKPGVKQGGSARKTASFDASTPDAILPNGRNLRNVWTIATHAYPEAHFATFPPKLAETCIKAGTSQKGVCSECGAPWVREVERTTATPGQNPGYLRDTGMRNDGDRAGNFTDQTAKTTGWSPSCACGAKPVSATVLDPFGGSGTVGMVARNLNRNAILIELNPDYCAMAERRCGAGPLFAEATP